MTLIQTLAIIDFLRRATIGEFSSASQYAKALVCLALDTVEISELKMHLTDVARERDERIADAAQIAKLAGLL